MTREVDGTNSSSLEAMLCVRQRFEALSSSAVAQVCIFGDKKVFMGGIDMDSSDGGGQEQADPTKSVSATTQQLWRVFRMLRAAKSDDGVRYSTLYNAH